MAKHRRWEVTWIVGGGQRRKEVCNSLTELAEAQAKAQAEGSSPNVHRLNGGGRNGSSGRRPRDQVCRRRACPARR